MKEKDKLDKIGDKAHYDFLSLSKTVIIDGVEMTVLPYGYLEVAVKKYAKEYADWNIKECLPERKAGTPVKKPKLGRPRKYKSVEVSTYNPYEDGWNACIDQILINKDKKK